MKRLLITGGAGFIGNAIIERIHSKYDITVLDCFSSQIHGEDYKKSFLYQNIKDKCTIIKGNVCNREDLSRALNGIEFVIHLAAETGTGQSMYAISHYTEVNILGTSNLLEVILKNKLPIKKIILSSSRSVYGEGMYECKKDGTVVPNSRQIENMRKKDFEVKCPICNGEVTLINTKESSTLKPISYYAYTKMAQEKMLELMCPTMGIKYTIFRYQNVYGAGQSLNNPYTGILSIFSKQLLRNQDINIFEDGEESRDFIHVKDVAAFTCNAIENNLTDNQYLNVGSGEKVSVKRVATTLKELYNSKSEIRISGDFRIGDIRHNIAEMTNTKLTTGIIPEYYFEKGMQEFSKWVMSENKNQIIEKGDGLFEKSLAELKAAGMMIESDV